MKHLLLLITVLFGFNLSAQNNLVVFSENGEPFYLIVNGVKQNLEPQTNVKVLDLIQPMYKVKVVFSEKGKGEVSQNVYLADGGEPVKNQEFVYTIKLTKKAVYKIRPVSMAPISGEKVDKTQSVVHYTTVEPTKEQNNVVHVSETNAANTTMNENVSINVSDNTSMNNAGGQTSISTSENVSINGNTTTKVQVTETTTQSQATSNPNSVNTSVGIDMMGMNVNVNVNENSSGQTNNQSFNQTTTITSQTVTTSSSHASSGTNVTPSSSTSKVTTSGGMSEPKTVTAVSKTEVKKAEPLPGYNGEVGCSNPMSTKSFSELKKSMTTKNFEDAKMKIVKQALDRNCMLSSQVKELMLEFKFDDARLDLAKYAYKHTYDLSNYYKLNDAFKFESSIDELDAFI
ncbi:MAG: DUF4476 domain-containing protein, partial [Bacteroidia bacterium]